MPGTTSDKSTVRPSFAMRLKNYQARDYLQFLGRQAKQETLQREHLPLMAWPRKRIKPSAQGRREFESLSPLIQDAQAVGCAARASPRLSQMRQKRCPHAEDSERSNQACLGGPFPCCRNPSEGFGPPRGGEPHYKGDRLSGAYHPPTEPSPDVGSIDGKIAHALI